MRYLILILVLGISSLQGISAQVITEEESRTSQELYDFHIAKKKQHFTVAFITLGTGAAMFFGGISQNLNTCLLSDCNTGMPWVYSGVAVGLSSIYFFERGFAHKKKAKLQLQSGAVGLHKEIRYSGLAIIIDF